jgi:hypothetical protein
VLHDQVGVRVLPGDEVAAVIEGAGGAVESSSYVWVMGAPSFSAASRARTENA